MPKTIIDFTKPPWDPHTPACLRFSEGDNAPSSPGRGARPAENTNYARQTYSDHVDEGRLPGVLQADQGQLHLLLPEQALEPVQYSVDERQHFGLLAFTFATTTPTDVFQAIVGYVGVQTRGNETQ